MFSIMEYVTGTVQRHWAKHRADAVKPGAPLFLGRSMMLIDEAWHLIRRDETGEYANDLARRARHLGLALIVMSQQLSDFNTDYGKALVRNSAQQLLLAQNPQEIPFIAETVELSEREANELGRLKTVKGRHAQMLWLNGARGHGKVTLRVGPSEYWAFTSDPTEVAMRDTAIAEHGGDVWAAHQRARPPRHPRPSRRILGASHRCRRALIHGSTPRVARGPHQRDRRRPKAAPRLGPLLAVCGLTGGAGTTTIAYLVARAAARQQAEPVLVADAGGPSGGLAALAGVEVPHSLPELADQLASARKLTGALYATSRDGLRVLASGPEFGSTFDPVQRGEIADRRARGARADRARLRHARPRRRPGVRPRGHARRLGLARNQARHQPRSARPRLHARDRRPRAARGGTRVAGSEGAAPRAQAAGGRAARAAGADAGSARPRQRQARPSRRGGPGPGAGDPRSAPAMRIARDEIETTPALGPRPPRTHPSPIPVRRCQRAPRRREPEPRQHRETRSRDRRRADARGMCHRDRRTRGARSRRTHAGSGSRSPDSPRVRPSPPRSSSTTCARCSRWPVCCSSLSRRSGARAPPNPGPSTGSSEGPARCCSAAGIAANVIVVGASLGAYGTRMVLAALPHGPVELGAYALALSLYVQGRDRPLPGRLIVAVAALSVAALALAAILETFVNV